MEAFRVSTTKAAQLMLIRECASFLGETIKLDGLPSTNQRSLESVYDQVQTQLTQVLRPFTIVVLGSFNTGKSTLINAYQKNHKASFFFHLLVLKNLRVDNLRVNGF